MGDEYDFESGIGSVIIHNISHDLSKLNPAERHR
jgi:hypothetical protein